MDASATPSLLGWVVAAFSLGQLVASPIFRPVVHQTQILAGTVGCVAAAAGGRKRLLRLRAECGW
ncbi:hypothetical protein C0Q70_06247 [Pomacea canaliculata]|uniref:Uncharacterized protein n=1 Tax=Pomacea canaliculata TaxID=400727 RepID=A0A2T7PNF5_POMCA|nr:hypothetical protein C0Q70_06247 [Pomacea canaliculata]